MVEIPVVRIDKDDSDISPVATRFALKLRQSSWGLLATSTRGMIAFPKT